MLKLILRYIRGTPSMGIQLRAASTPTLTAYSNADWAGCPDTHRSTSGFCVFFGDALISWSSKRQTTLSRSSDEAEYTGVANTVAECSWLRSLLGELRIDINSVTIVFCNNISAEYMTRNPVHHKRTKHIELDMHFVCEKVALGHVRVLHVPSTQQLADIFTKGLPTQLYNDFRNSFCIDTTKLSLRGVLAHSRTARAPWTPRTRSPRCADVPPRPEDSLAMTPSIPRRSHSAALVRAVSSLVS
jgi:hypothetical protein